MFLLLSCPFLPQGGRHWLPLAPRSQQASVSTSSLTLPSSGDQGLHVAESTGRSSVLTASWMYLPLCRPCVCSSVSCLALFLATSWGLWLPTAWRPPLTPQCPPLKGTALFFVKDSDWPILGQRPTAAPITYARGQGHIRLDVANGVTLLAMLPGKGPPQPGKHPIWCLPRSGAGLWTRTWVMDGDGGEAGSPDI